MPTFKQAQYDRFDMEHPHSVHHASAASLPEELPADRLLVHMQCAPVHPCDTLCAMGVVNGVKLPAVGGTEGLGIIENVGEALKDRWQPGQRVHVAANYIFGEWNNWTGTWREYMHCPENALFPIPDGIDDDSAAQLLVNPLTTLAMVKQFGLGDGNILLQSAAGSVLGQLMIQLSKVFGFETVNLVRRRETADELKNEFAIDSVYVYDGSEASADEVRTAIRADFSGRAIDFCIEAVGGDTANLCLQLLGPNGEMYIYGMMTGQVMLAINTAADICMKNNALKGWSTQETWMRQKTDEEKRQHMAELCDLLASGRMKLPPSGQRFTLDQVGEAMSASFEPGRKGKIMLDCR